MKLKSSKLSGSKGVFIKNTAMLYILQFSTYLLGLLITPYETRVLGDVAFGYLGASASIMVYFQLIIDFGFLLSATEEVSRFRQDKDALSRIFTSVVLCKLGLAAMSFVVLYWLCQIIPAWHQKQALLLLTFAASFLNSMMPDFLYRGMEQMGAITIRTVSIRCFFTVTVLLFLKRPEDICIIPILNIIGNFIALVFVYFDLHRRFSVHLCKVRKHTVWRVFRRSSTFFYSRIATTAYTALNTVILDIISAGGAVTGYYTSANTLITAGKNGLTPISDSLYPYMARHRDFKMVKKVLLIFEPPIILFCTVAFIWAEPLCSLFFGEAFAPAGLVLRAMLPVGVVVLPSYVLGFPTMTAMGLSRFANYSVIAGSALHVCILAMLFITNSLNMITLGCSVSITECVILLFRVAVIVKNRHLMNNQEAPENGNS